VGQEACIWAAYVVSGYRMNCSICLHPKLPEIEDALSTGLTVRAAQARYGLSKSAVARHRANCLAPKVAAAARIMTPSGGVGTVKRAKQILQGASPTASDALTLSGLLERVARSLDRLDGAADKAATDNLHAALAAVSGQLHKGVETAAKLQGIYSDAAPSAGEKFSIKIVLPSPREGALNVTALADIELSQPATEEAT